MPKRYGVRLIKLRNSYISIKGFKIDTETKALIPCDVIPAIMDVVGVGQSELDTYNEACLAVKARFSKPEIE